MLNHDACCIKICILANIADPDELLHNAAFHQGFHCMIKYLYAVVVNENGLIEQGCGNK